MKGLLVRIGVDQAYGGCNVPVHADRHFVYVPIPEKRGTYSTRVLNGATTRCFRPCNAFAGNTIANYAPTCDFPRSYLKTRCT